jgi:hypothetical protein
MKYIFVFSLIYIFLFSCRKDNPSVSSPTIAGTLRFSNPELDGIGLYFETDSMRPMLFKNEFSDLNTQYLHFKEWVGIHARLTYIDHGETGCTLGLIPCPQQHPIPLVEVVKLEKD